MSTSHQPSVGTRQQLWAVEVAKSRGRQSPSTDFGTLLRRGASSTLGTIGAHTAGYLPPGGAVVSAALSGAGTALDASASTPAGPAGPALASGAGSLPGLGGGGTDQWQLLAATQNMQRENQMYSMTLLQMQDQTAVRSQTYSALSNILKRKDESARNAISNFR